MCAEERVEHPNVSILSLWLIRLLQDALRAHSEPTHLNTEGEQEMQLYIFLEQMSLIIWWSIQEQI